MISVELFAKQFETGRPIANARIIDLNSQEVWETNEEGESLLRVQAGRILNLVFEKAGFARIQNGHIQIPDYDLRGELKEITFQVPSSLFYRILRPLLGAPAKNLHAVVTTVSALGHSLRNDHGEAGCSVSLESLEDPEQDFPPTYLGSLYYFQKTEFIFPALSRFPYLAFLAHKSTTVDGGVIFKNVPKGEYILQAYKEGLEFNKVKLKIEGNSPELINASPPHGLRVLEREKA